MALPKALTETLKAPETKRMLFLGGAAAIGGAVVLGGAAWLVRRFAQGDVIKLKILHEIDPEMKRIAESYQPILDRGVDVNLRFGPGKGSPPSTPPAVSGYTPPISRSPSMSSDLLFALGADLAADSELSSEEEDLAMLDSFGDLEVLPGDDDDLISSMLGADDEMGEDADVLGEDDFGEDDLGADADPDVVGRIKFDFQSPIEVTIDEATKKKLIPGRWGKEILKAIPYMTSTHLKMISFNPFRKGTIRKAALAELERRKRGGVQKPIPQNAFPPPRQGWRPGTHWPQGVSQPRYPRRGVRPAVPRPLPPHFRRPVGPPPRPAVSPFRPAPRPAPVPSVLRPERQILPPARRIDLSTMRLGAETSSYSLLDAWMAHPFQTLAATAAVFAAGVALSEPVKDQVWQARYRLGW